MKIDCDTLIGVYVNPLEKIKIGNLKHSYNVAERAYKIKMADDSIQKFGDCDMVVRPKGLNMFGTFQMSGIDAIFDLGYTETKRLLETNNLFMER